MFLLILTVPSSSVYSFVWTFYRSILQNTPFRINCLTFAFDSKLFSSQSSNHVCWVPFPHWSHFWITAANASGMPRSFRTSRFNQLIRYQCLHSWYSVRDLLNYRFFFSNVSRSSSRDVSLDDTIVNYVIHRKSRWSSVYETNHFD